MHKLVYLIVGCGLVLGWAAIAMVSAHEPPADAGPSPGQGGVPAGDIIADWVFWPQYTLGQNARNHPGPAIAAPTAPLAIVREQPTPLRFFGQRPTERRLELLEIAELPRDELTLEMWLGDHVNQPVGLLMAARSRQSARPPGVALGYFDDTAAWMLSTSEGAKTAPLRLDLSEGPAFKGYWRHIIATYDGERTRIYVNGKRVGTDGEVRGPIDFPADGVFEIAAYMKNEPYMEIANLVHAVRVYRRALTPQEIEGRFQELAGQVERGILYPGRFHFNAGPYLNFATESSINVLWETDRPARATLRWGKSAAVERSHKMETARRLQEATIDDLQPSTPYFYKVTATDESGESIDSGVLTFATAVRPGEPFKFGLIGDTEARPHINNRIAQLLWEERPNFIVNLGDLTDGGTEAHKFQWNMEYFVGVNHLTSRIPVFAVPGNGEDDLYWYSRYHAYPDLESVYSFRYGDAEFFMLDSNRKDEFAPGGRQYEWLGDRLQKSTSRWKFVCHHHAPFTSEENDYGDAWTGDSARGDAAIRRIVPLYEEHGVDVVMFGHLHLYERTLPIREGKVDLEHGVMYLLAGGAGGNLEDFAPTPAPFSAKTYRGHHYCVASIAGDTLSMRMYGVDGALRDVHEIRKSRRLEKTSEDQSPDSN